MFKCSVVLKIVFEQFRTSRNVDDSFSYLCGTCRLHWPDVMSEKSNSLLSSKASLKCSFLILKLVPTGLKIQVYCWFPINAFCTVHFWIGLVQQKNPVILRLKLTAYSSKLVSIWKYLNWYKGATSYKPITRIAASHWRKFCVKKINIAQFP